MVYVWVCTHVLVEASCESGFSYFTIILFLYFYYEYWAVTVTLEGDDVG